MPAPAPAPKPAPSAASYGIAERDPRGDIRMSRGHGALVALQSDTRYQIEERMLDARAGRHQDQYKAALALLDREAEQARIAVGRPRPNTPDRKTLHGRSITVKRLCNGCGRNLGDATKAELEAARLSPSQLPDVRSECGCINGGR